jgi:hypothetical protein
MMKIEHLMSRPTVRGFEARAGLESFGAMLCKMWGLPPITITWGPISTACIDQQGNATLADIADDATVTRTEVARYAGFLLHELLHRRYTDFTARDGRPYVDRLHNAIEDAWIESRCIREGLTGNARGLLHQLIKGMVDDAPATVDWSAIAQYPFSLAVYLRQYGVTVPVPASLMPTYREALRRLPACSSSTDTLALAQWVFSQMQQQQPEQSSKPDQQQGDQPGKDQGDGQGDGQGDQTGDQQRQTGKVRGARGCRDAAGGICRGGWLRVTIGRIADDPGAQVPRRGADEPPGEVHRQRRGQRHRRSTFAPARFHHESGQWPRPSEHIGGQERGRERSRHLGSDRKKDRRDRPGRDETGELPSHSQPEPS